MLAPWERLGAKCTQSYPGDSGVLQDIPRPPTFASPTLWRANELKLEASSTHGVEGATRTANPQKTMFLCESDPLEGGRAQIGSELDPWSRGSNPNGKPKHNNVFQGRHDFHRAEFDGLLKLP